MQPDHGQHIPNVGLAVHSHRARYAGHMGHLFKGIDSAAYGGRHCLPTRILPAVGRGPPIDLQPDLDRVRNSRIPVTMDACILGGTEHIPPLRQNAPYRFLWLVDPELIHSADTVAMLLMMGAFLADPPTAGMRSRVFQVSSTLYNSVERDLALKVYSHLEAVLNGSRQDSQEKFQDEFALPDSARSKIMKSLPGLTDLPVTGDLAALADTADSCRGCSGPKRNTARLPTR